jgi:bifunctional DNA-binding transcriptional regulator/antitoxin component of YhaV-PrlF toxin-antitoxin module
MITVVPHTIVEKMKLTDSDILEWIQTNKGEIIVRKL